MCAIIVCVVVQLLAFPVPKYNMMFGANAVRAFRTFSAKLVKANPLLHCTCEDFSLFSSLFSLCWDQSLLGPFHLVKSS